MFYACLLSMSSSFLFVFDANCVTCHMGADDIAGDVVDA